MGGFSEYRGKRDRRRTPEPFPAEGVLPRGNDDTFVIHEHHASQLHWDVRLERDGVLVSWAVPKGLPTEPGTIRMAVHTEDHPLEYADFAGKIPRGEYGAGQMIIWDRGAYQTVKWSDREVDVILHGTQVDGEFVFFRTAPRTDDQRSGSRDGRNWMVRRRHNAARPDWVALPEFLSPMMAIAAPELPSSQHDTEWSYEFKWDGVRAIARVDGGRVRLTSRIGNDITVAYPELRGVGSQLGARQVLLDGEIVAMASGKPSFSALQQRMHVSSAAAARRLSTSFPVTYLIFDLLHVDGVSTVDLPYSRRRELLLDLNLRGKYWLTPPAFDGGGQEVLAASRERGLEGVVAKRSDSRYLAGVRSPLWLKITQLPAQEVVIGGWRPGEGKRKGVIGALLLGIPVQDGLEFVGSVSTGFSDEELTRITQVLHSLASRQSPFVTPLPPERARGARWVYPELVGEVKYREWTPEGRMRFPTWRGLRPDKTIEQVRRIG